MVFCPATGKRTSKCKVKGITLNYNNSEVNFNSLRSMILEDDTPLHVHNPKKIKRKHCGVVVSEPETKEYKVVFKKRRLKDNFDSLPYGYNQFVYLYRILFIRLFICRSVYLYRILFIHVYLFIYTDIYLLRPGFGAIYFGINRDVFGHQKSFYSMTLKLQHPFTLIVAGTSSCGKSTFVIRLIECREQLCDVVYDNIVWCHSENKAPHHLKNVSFVEGVPDF